MMEARRSLTVAQVARLARPGPTAGSHPRQRPAEAVLPTARHPLIGVLLQVARRRFPLEMSLQAARRKAPRETPLRAAPRQAPHEAFLRAAPQSLPAEQLLRSARRAPPTARHRDPELRARPAQCARHCRDFPGQSTSKWIAPGAAARAVSAEARSAARRARAARTPSPVAQPG